MVLLLMRVFSTHFLPLPSLFGIPCQDAILDVVTSGQIAWDGLRQRVDEPFKSLGAKCLVFGNGDDDIEVRERGERERQKSERLRKIYDVMS